jgi:RecB family exonuclease
VADGGTVARALALDAAAWEPRLTAYDGLIDVTADGGRLSRLRLDGQTTSATKVQNFAACPYRHLLDRGFGLRKWEDPEHVYQLDAASFGGFYHGVAHRLFEWLRDEGLLPLQPSSIPAAERQLAVVLDAVAHELVAEGKVLNASLVEPAKGRVRMEIAELLDRESRRDPDGFVPALFEQRYEGLEVEFDGGRKAAFNGSLDRVDVRDDPRTVRVVYYKTGKYRWKDGEQFRGGRELQLAIYNEAVQAIEPGAKVAEARYYHATSASRFRSKSCPASSEVARALRQVLAALDDTAQAGVFAPVADSCDFCDFAAICGAYKEQRFARKKTDPRLSTFLVIRDIQ